MRRRLRSFARDCRGAAGVETVLILPFAILLLVTAMEAGNYLYAEHQVVKGVRDAARYAGRLPLATYGCTGAAAPADLPTGDAWNRIAYIAIYGKIPASDGVGGYTLPTSKRLWTWDATASDISIRYACAPSSNGIYATSGIAPVVTVIGKPEYPSLFRTMAGLPGTLRLYARQQAVVAGL